ncbi:MAG: TOBE domain-containing protein, partial [Armatimonadota bacterium]
SFRVKIPDSRTDSLREWVGKPLVFGIRPDDMFDKSLSPTVRANDCNTLRVAVEVVEPMGATSILYLNTGTDTLVASVDSATRARENEALDIVLDVEKAHLFDKETEKTIY